MEKVLLHTCCGPCSTYTVKRLRDMGLEPSAFWFNPNIHPFTEHEKRLEAMQAFAAAAQVSITVSEGYGMADFLQKVAGKVGERCGDCYHLRLSRVAREAKERRFQGFSTTLLISPYQKHGLLKEVGEQVAREAGVGFCYEDFRAGFSESRRLSKELGLYRQRYCGCIYSEYERYAPSRTAKQ